MAKQTLVIRPVNHNILVELIEDTTYASALIVIPESAKQESQRGIVKALGQGVENKAGVLVPFPYKVGDELLINKYGGAAIDLGKKKYKMLAPQDVLAVLELVDEPDETPS